MKRILTFVALLVATVMSPPMVRAADLPIRIGYQPGTAPRFFVVIVAIVAYPAGLLPQPPEGTGAWWLARLEWVVVLGLVTAVELVLLWSLRRFFAAPLPMLGMPLTERWGEVFMLAGTALAASGLHFFAYAGFAPDGRFPWVTATVFAIGVLLVALRPTKVGRRAVDPAPATGRARARRR